MAEEGKKISFGFAKSIKKPALKNAVPREEKKVDYIECLDEKSIKVIGKEEEKNEPLVIPLIGSRTWHDRIVNKIDADIFEPKAVKTEVKQEVTNGDASPREETPLETNTAEPVKIKTEPVEEEKPVSLEEQAAKEIIEDLNGDQEKKSATEPLTLPLGNEESLRGEAESTLDDYEKIPVDAFGMAMLRGMGWQPGKGIGKSEKIVAAVIPELRPKGMGLGADKVTRQKQTNTKKQEEELKIEKGAYVKIIAGKQSDSYGQIEGFDDDAGRLIVKLALGGNTVSLSEFMVQAVSGSEYTKNSKVLNAKKFEEYKDKGASGKHRSRSPESSKSSDSGDKDRQRSHAQKKSKTRKRSSSSDSDSNHRRKAKRSSSSEEDHRSKKSKKSKKHKRQDSSPERSSRKHKKKDKERERTKDKKSRDLEHSEKRKRKKHRKSRSRSRSSGRR